MLVLTNCTFDGHMYNAKRTMEECLAIKPDLIFLWDEAWFGFARFTPFLRRRTGDGRRRGAPEQMHDPEYRKRYEEFKAQAGKLDPTDPKLLDMHLLPDPDQVRIRVYETDSMHKSMSALRQGSIILVADQDFHDVEEAFHEAYFTHTSTSPNLQIIASLDVARRQMELEGYELVSRTIAAGARDPAGGQQASADLEILPRRHAGGDDPGGVPESGFDDYGPPDGTWRHDARRWTRTSSASTPPGITLLCGTAGYDGTQFKALLAERARHPDQQDLPQQRAGADQHQQHPQRPGAHHQGAGRHGPGDRQAARRGRRGRAGGLRGARQVADGGCAGPAELQPVPRRLPRQPEERHAGRPHARGVLHGLRRRATASTSSWSSKEIDERLKKGPELVSANFVIPYPPGFPIMVPGQVITPETIDSCASST